MKIIRDGITNDPVGLAVEGGDEEQTAELAGYMVPVVRIAETHAVPEAEETAEESSSSSSSAPAEGADANPAGTTGEEL